MLVTWYLAQRGSHLKERKVKIFLMPLARGKNLLQEQEESRYGRDVIIVFWRHKAQGE